MPAAGNSPNIKFASGTKDTIMKCMTFSKIPRWSIVPCLDIIYLLYRLPFGSTKKLINKPQLVPFNMTASPRHCFEIFSGNI